MKHLLKTAAVTLKREQLRLKYTLYNELPLRELHDRPAGDENRNSFIPSYVYQTWEDNLFGRTHLAAIERFRDLNPGMHFRLFDRKLRGNYMLDSWGNHPIYPIFQNAQFGPMQADIFRYCILCERGGYYFDINKGCSIPLVSLCSKDSLGLISFERNDCFIPPSAKAIDKILHPTKYVLQWGMGFVKEHPVLVQMIANICEYYPFYKNKIFHNPKHAILSFTGPGMFTKTVRDVVSNQADIGITQAGIDFNDSGAAFKRSKVRYLTVPAYTDFKNAIIVT